MTNLYVINFNLRDGYILCQDTDSQSLLDLIKENYNRKIIEGQEQCVVYVLYNVQLHLQFT